MSTQADIAKFGPESTAATASLAGERVAFTGTLASMTHREAHKWVESCGGVPTDAVSRHTTLLIIGEEGWPLESDGRPSVKLQQAHRYIGEGAAIRVASEAEWLGFIGLDDRLAVRSQVYTPAMLSQLLSVNVHDIRRWERLGLIRAVRRVHRLPYFDLKQVSSAQRLAELVAAGVPVEKIRESLRRIAGWVENTAEPLAQLDLLAQDQQLVYRDSRGRLKTSTGQCLFDFDRDEAKVPVEESSASAMETEPPDQRGRAEWFEEGQQRAADGNLPGAVEAYRMSLMIDYDFPEVHFHLADVLYRLGNERGALERYYMAAELDHHYLEAWTQIGCLHAALGEPEAAVEAFDVALDVHPEFADAHFHKAETLWQLNRPQAARPHWLAYLAHVDRGPWADLARARLDTPIASGGGDHARG